MESILKLLNGARNEVPTFAYTCTLSLLTYIYDDRHGSIVHWLGAVRPEVGALSQVNVAGAQAAKKGETKQPI